MSFNTIILVGNLGGDPELRYTPQGDAVCNFTMATNEKKKDRSGEYQNVATWFKVTLWRKTAEAASKYLVKGSPVYIQGRLGVETWTDRDGKDRFTLTVNAQDMQFIGSKDGNSGGGEYDQSRPSGNYSQAPAADNFPTHSGGGPAPAEGFQAAGSATPASASPAPAYTPTAQFPNPPVGAAAHGTGCTCPQCDDIPF